MYLEKSFPVVTDGQFVVVAPGDLMPRFIGMRYAYGHHLLAVLAVGKEQCQAGIRMSLVARAGEAYRIGMVEIIRLFAEGAGAAGIEQNIEDGGGATLRLSCCNNRRRRRRDTPLSSAGSVRMPAV